MSVNVLINETLSLPEYFQSALGGFTNNRACTLRVRNKEKAIDTTQLRIPTLYLYHQSHDDAEYQRPHSPTKNEYAYDERLESEVTSRSEKVSSAASVTMSSRKASVGGMKILVPRGWEAFPLLQTGADYGH